MAIIYGTKNADTKNGTKGNDTIYGWASFGNANSPSGDDTLNGNAGSDKLYGGTGRDSLNGAANNDTLDGGLGTDTLNGGAGNDTYIIVSTFDSEGNLVTDSVTEAASSGTDTVQLTIEDLQDVIDKYNLLAKSQPISYQLDSNLENLTLKVKGKSSNIAQTIVTGNASNNIIFGGDADNYFRSIYDKYGVTFSYGLIGGDGNDKLYGEAGDDALDGGTGIDTLIGGIGSDRYAVDSTTDTITEYFNEGIDWVESSVSYTLGENSNIENLVLLGSAVSGTGNSLDNSIYGSNDANNSLYGGLGNDFLAGYDNLTFGSSTDASDDYLDGGAGNDTLEAGYGGNDTLQGGNGNDNLYGGSDSDTHTGGAGADTFYFYSPSDGIDNITDFLVADDTINVYSPGFGGGLTYDAAITTAQFTIGSAASDASDRFIYNQNTGALFFDSDGTGTAEQVQFAKLSTGLAMTNADIFVT